MQGKNELRNPEFRKKLKRVQLDVKVFEILPF